MSRCVPISVALAGSAALGLACLTGGSVSAVASQSETSDQPLPGGSLLSQLIPGGEWLAYRPLGSAGNGRRAVATQSSLVRPQAFPCPSGTTDYRGSSQPFSCLVVFRDNDNMGHSVGLRQGRSDPNGFGLLHAVGDHNLDQESIGTVVVNSAAGIKQGSRLRYEARGFPLVAVEVIEDRTSSTAAPDKQALGVLTAYCRGLERCPDWVNESLP